MIEFEEFAPEDNPLKRAVINDFNQDQRSKFEDTGRNKLISMQSNNEQQLELGSKVKNSLLIFTYEECKSKGSE